MMLNIENLHVKYGNVEALHGIDIAVDKGEIVAILGANGAGKSTTLNTICGIFKTSQGSIRFDGRELHKMPAHDIVRLGVAQVPEGRRVFGTLSVRANLNLGAFTCKDKKLNARNLAWIFDLFPRLAERSAQLAGTLSGGEQQMLAIGRALMANPRILLLDEPSLGLAPILVKAIFDTVRQINSSGLTVVIVEQNARAALKLAHRGYVMEVGRIVMEDSAQNLLADPNIQNAYLGGAH
jgi:branched-chain amino acid transport system ATP-binding protein